MLCIQPSNKDVVASNIGHTGEQQGFYIIFLKRKVEYSSNYFITIKRDVLPIIRVPWLTSSYLGSSVFTTSIPLS